jgi:hypothetical protein
MNRTPKKKIKIKNKTRNLQPNTTKTENTKQNIAGNNRRNFDEKTTKHKQQERKNKTTHRKQERTKQIQSHKQNIKDRVG